MIGKYFTQTSNKVELRINRVRINCVRPVIPFMVISDLLLKLYSVGPRLKLACNMGLSPVLITGQERLIQTRLIRSST